MCPGLQQTIDASELAAPIISSELVHAPVNFICCEPQQWHYRGVSHVLLNNAAAGGNSNSSSGGQSEGSISVDVSRAMVAKLAASPSFRLLVTTAPLPFQHHLVHIGDVKLRTDAANATFGSSPTGSASGGAGGSHPEEPRQSSATAIGAAVSSIVSAGELHTKGQLPPPESLQGDSEEGHLELFFYSKSYESAPAGTLASLYCTQGICCLPGPALHSLAAAHTAGLPLEQQKQLQMAGGAGGGGARPTLGLPPLAAHTSAYKRIESTRSFWQPK